MIQQFIVLVCVICNTSSMDSITFTRPYPAHSIRKAAAVCGRYMLQHSTQQVTLRFAAEEVAVVTRPRVLARIAADLRELK